MTLRRYVQLDVFADRPGAGNPLAVVLDTDGLDDAAMQAIARWTRRPETTFVFAPTHAGADYRVRMFSPQREVPFAGHPSIGTAFALLDAGMLQPHDGRLQQECAIGVLPMTVEGEDAGRTIAIRTPKARTLEVADRADPRLVAAVASLPEGALPPALVDGGRRWWMVEVRDETALRGATPGWAAIGELATATDSMGLCAFARADAGQDYDVVVRAFVGANGMFEDAASGAANAALASWLASNDALPGRDGGYVASQGREVGFDARLQLRVDDDGEVWSGGRACVVTRGQIDW